MRNEDKYLDNTMIPWNKQIKFLFTLDWPKSNNSVPKFIVKLILFFDCGTRKVASFLHALK